MPRTLPLYFGDGDCVVFALARMALYCVAGPHYGYFRDELYYLACGEHPAWGYVDQPPLICWAAWLLEHTIGTSLWALRLLPALALAIAGVGGVYLPTMLPILSVPDFLAYEHALGIEQQRFENQPQGVLPQLYADMFGWEEVAQRVAAYYRTLSPEEQRKTAIFANNYGDGGAIDFFGPRYGLPKAIGNHQNYWIWGPRDYTGESLIVLGEGHERNMQMHYASYSIIGNTKDPLSRPDEWLPIYHCRGYGWNLQEIWPRMKHWD